QTTTGTDAAKRPVFLTVLCILSFIAAGLAILGYITIITVMGAVTAGASALEGMSSEANAAMSQAVSTGPSAALTWAYIVVGFVTVLISLYGVIQMWKLKKMGFYLYVGASAVSMIMGIVYSGFGVMAVVFPVLFIVLYGLNLKHLK
ncbi:MAG: hypothetical protein ABIP51_12195, partial [Bacteroidia bacterium]